jgi:hypothetical protein
MFYCAFGLYPELAIIPIGTVDNPHTFDLLGGEGRNLLFLVAYQAQATYPTPISEGDMLPVRLNLPSGLFVLYAPVIVLKLGIALLTGLMVLAVVIEPGDSEPRSIRRSLTGLRVKARGKGIVFGKSSTVALQVILVDTPRVHPQAQALVADELDHADSLINSLILLGATVEFVLANEHPLAFLLVLC